MNQRQVVQPGGVGARSRRISPVAAPASIAPRYMNVRSRPADAPIRDRVGLVVERVLDRQVHQALRDAEDDHDDQQEPDCGVRTHQQQQGGRHQLADRADDQLGPDLRLAPGQRDHPDAEGERRQQHQPGLRRGQPTAILEPLREAVEEAVRDGRRDDTPGVRDQQRRVAGEHPDVDEGVRLSQLPEREPGRGRGGEGEQPEPARPADPSGTPATWRGSRRTAARRPGRARGVPPVGRCSAVCFGSTRKPSTRQATESGRLTANVARQPPRSISSPPSVGPMTIARLGGDANAVSTAAGRSPPVRRPSLRIRCMRAG